MLLKRKGANSATTIEIETETAIRVPGRLAEDRTAASNQERPDTTVSVAGARLLEIARRVAAEFAEKNAWGLCSADEVFRELGRRGGDPYLLSPVLGFIFRTRDWQRLPVRIRSRRPGSRSRDIRLYRFVGRSGGGQGSDTGFSISWDWD